MIKITIKTGKGAYLSVMSPANVLRGQREGEDGPVGQTLCWTEGVPFGRHTFGVLFSGEIGPKAATLWVWVTDDAPSFGQLRLSTA